MGERYVEDKKNNLIYLGDSSSAEGTFNDECLVYNTINKTCTISCNNDAITDSKYALRLLFKEKNRKEIKKVKLIFKIVPFILNCIYSLI